MNATVTRHNSDRMFDIEVSKGMSERGIVLATIPMFMLFLYVAFSFVAFDWGWITQTRGSAENVVEYISATNSNFGRFFFVLLSVGYASTAVSMIRKSEAEARLAQYQQDELSTDMEVVKDRVRGVMSAWVDHLNNDELEIEEVYVGRDKKAASDSLKKMLAMTVDQISSEVVDAIDEEKAT